MGGGALMQCEQTGERQQGKHSGGGGTNGVDCPPVSQSDFCESAGCDLSCERVGTCGELLSAAL